MPRSSSRDGPASRSPRQMMDELEAQIEALKIRYEKYFLGLDKRAPSQEHQQVKRALRELEGGHQRATALRFRLNTLRARLVTYEHYWTRIMRQIEEGTYRRHLDQVARKRQREEDLRKAAEAAGQPPGGVERRARRRTPADSPTLPDGVDPAEVRDLYRALVKAKRAAGESTAKLSYGNLVRKLARELPRLREKHGRDVRLEVHTRDGKVRLRARPKGAG